MVFSLPIFEMMFTQGTLQSYLISFQMALNSAERES